MINFKTGFPDIWLTDLTRGNSAPFTFGPSVNASAVWAPEGSKILFRSTRTGGLTEFYTKSAGGGGKEDPVLSQSLLRTLPGALSANTVPTDWSRDGRHLLFTANASADADIWHANFSPKGDLVAYTSSESGRLEIKVQTFPLSDRQWTVSTEGGYEPRWRPDGGEIYYLSADRKLMVVPVGPGPSFGAAKPLFQTSVSAMVLSQRTHYVPSRDGQRFLIGTPIAEKPPAMAITVVMNATAGFKK